MDDNKNNHISFYANKEQLLENHLYAIAYLTYAKLKGYGLDESTCKLGFLIGIFHDLGKVDPTFQKYLLKLKEQPMYEDGLHIDKLTGFSKFTFEKHPRHNELSLLLLEYLSNDELLKLCGNKQNIKLLKKLTHSHHSRPRRKKELKTLDDIKRLLGNVTPIKTLIEASNSIITKINIHGSIQLPKLLDSVDDLEDIDIPKYKKYASIQGSNDIHDSFHRDSKLNAKLSLIMGTFTYYDKLVSKLSGNVLDDLITNGNLDSLLNTNSNDLSDRLGKYVERSIKEYGDTPRTQNQVKYADEFIAIDSNVLVTKGSAGVGKTQAALLALTKANANSVIWVAPRQTVCQGVYNELCSYGLDASIEIKTSDLTFTYKDGQESLTPRSFSADIIITTIDQLHSWTSNASRYHNLPKYLDSFVVFDEFHEIIDIKGMNLTLIELIKMKEMIRVSPSYKTTLMSATINPYFIYNVLDIYRDHVLDLGIYNENEYKLNILNYDDRGKDYHTRSPMYGASNRDNHLFIYNTAIDAQKSYIINSNENESTVLYHSKYTKNDKLELSKRIFDNFGKKPIESNYNIIRSGPILKASLNISGDEMSSDLSSPESMLQSIGRLGRFGSKERVYNFNVVVSNSVIEKKKHSNSRAYQLCKSNPGMYDVMCAFYDSLKDIREFTLYDIYKCYDEFYSKNELVIQEHMIEVLKESVDKCNDPRNESFYIEHKNSSGSEDNENDVDRIKHSLRSDSVFVKLATLHLGDGVKCLNTYTDDITEDVNMLTDDKGDNTNLIDLMHRKHHNIEDDYSKRYSQNIIINEARSSNLPIYLSYTENDISKVGTDNDRNAIYYVESDHQPIGMINLSKVTDL